MEVEALERARLLSWMLFPVWIFLSVLQAICFALGNSDFHPLLSIIDTQDDKDEGTYTLSDKVFMIKISNSKLTIFIHFVAGTNSEEIYCYFQEKSQDPELSNVELESTYL